MDKINGILHDEQGLDTSPYESFPFVIINIGRIIAFFVCAAESPDAQKSLIGPTVKQISGIFFGPGLMERNPTQEATKMLGYAALTQPTVFATRQRFGYQRCGPSYQSQSYAAIHSQEAGLFYSADSWWPYHQL